MTPEPTRLLDADPSGLGSRLLAAGLDEPPPVGLAARTLDAVGAASGIAATASAAAIPAKAALGGGKLGAWIVSGGLVSAVVGAVAAVVVVAVVEPPVGARLPVGNADPSAAAKPPSALPAPGLAPAPGVPTGEPGSFERPTASASPLAPPPAPVDRSRSQPNFREAGEGVPAPAEALTASTVPERGGGARLALETALLDTVSRAIHSGDLPGARLALDRYDREFPSGQLRDEAAELRRQLRIKRPTSNP